MAVYITDALLEDIEADNGAKYSTLVTALVAEIRRLQKQLAPVEAPAAPEKPAAKAGMFGKVEQDWIKKDFVATWYEGDSVRRQTSGFTTRAEANRFLKAKGVTVYPLKAFNKKTQFRS